ncbi:MAG: aminotransferase-like domain-containing protein [Acidimicrobiales bacterium]
MDQSNQPRLAQSGHDREPQISAATPRGSFPLPPGWDHGAGPLHAKLSAAVERLILTGELGPGASLPTERDLASLASLSRSTVANAYRTLKRDGWIDSRQGRGTWVADGRHGSEPTAAHLAPLLSRRPGADNEVVDLALAVPRPTSALRIPPVPVVGAGTGYEPAGLAALRSAIAERHSRHGLATQPSQILITHGAQHAIGLVFAEYLRSGDTVVVESSTYVGALDAARLLDVTVAPVAVDAQGVVVDELAATVERRRPSLVYLNPTNHSPTGTTLSAARRRAVVGVASRAGIPLIDDATLAELTFHPDDRPVALAALDRLAPVITVGSLSKVVWAGLRVGWIRADVAVIEALVSRRMVGDLGGSLPSQLAALSLMERLDVLVAERTSELRARHDRLLDLVADRLPEWEVPPATGGLSVWAHLPHGVDADTLAATAAAHGVAVVAGPTLSPHQGAPDRVRLSFVQPEPVLDEGVLRLAAAWDHLRRSSRRGRLLV